MYPYIHIILPSYMLLAFMGGFCSLVYLFFRLEKFHIEFSQFITMFIFSVFGGAAGSKVLFAFTQVSWLMEHFSIGNLLLLIPQSGFVYYGGLFGVIASLQIYTRKDADLRNRVYRMAAPAIPMFHAFGRIGCFLAGCCYGKKLINPVNFMGITLERIPVQLFESAFEILLFLVLVILDKKKEGCDLLGFYLFCYAVFRFLDEYMRGDAVRGNYFGLSTAQWISLFILGYYTVIRHVPSMHHKQ